MDPYGAGSGRAGKRSRWSGVKDEPSKVSNRLWALDSMGMEATPGEGSERSRVESQGFLALNPFLFSLFYSPVIPSSPTTYTPPCDPSWPEVSP